MKLKKLFEDFRIPYNTDREQAGWLHIKCPFCGDHGTHLGGNLDNGVFNCFRCGKKDRVEVFIRILRVTKAEALKIISQYGGKARRREKAKEKVQTHSKQVNIPSGVVSGLNRLQKTYVESRGFNPMYLEKTWDLMSTGPVSFLDNIDYRFRILVPIYWEGRMVSFQCRDATGRSKLRYITCPEKHEAKHHKHILYSHHTAGESVICTEGVFDVWRLGTDAVATFGIEFSKQQVRELARRFNQVLVLFDKGLQAQKQAAKLVSELKFRGVDCENISNKLTASDPADMSQKEADKFMKDLGFIK